MAQATTRLAALFELQQGAGRNLSMEGLRGIAVTLVFFVHFHSVMEPWMTGEAGWGAQLASGLRFVGAAGVDLFFILSGYLIYAATLSQRFTWGAFLRRRVQRIYPAFLAILVLYLGLSFVMPEQSKLPDAPGAASIYVLQNLLLLPGMFAIEPIVTVAWSLSYEAFFYLVLPVLMVSLGLRSRPKAVRMGVFFACALMIIALPLLGLGHLQFLLFVAGMVLHELRDRVRSLQAGPSGPAWRWSAMILAAAALPVAWWLFHTVLASGARESVAFVARTVWLTAVFGWVVAVVLTAREDASGLARVCRWTPLRWLGNMSYSYYLVHGLALKALSVVALHLTSDGTTHPTAYWLLLPVAFVVTLVVSAGLFALVEKPLSLGAGYPWLSRPVAVVAPVPVDPDSSREAPRSDGPPR